MGVLKQGSPRSPFSVKSVPLKAPQCAKCHERKPDQIYVRNANGGFICADCQSETDRRALGSCDPETCACGKVEVAADGADDPA